ncbi:MAG: tandem-95 repeat protein [Chloroflexi bacterium]|nr:tandem-95 repeat protein [Chloroflexota bacterium]
MIHRRFLRIIHVITSYLVILSLLISPVYNVRQYATAAPGPTPDQQAAEVSLSLTKSDSLLNDADGDGRIGAGDTLRYTLTAHNTGTVDASDVWLEDVLESNLSLVPGSLRTTPLAFAQTIEVLEDSAPVPFTLIGADFDGDPLTYNITTQPVYGVIGGTAPNLTYQPAVSNFNGTDSLVFEVCDASTPPSCDSAVVQINILPVNDAPSFTPGSTAITVLEDQGEYTQANWATAISTGPANESSQAYEFIVTNDNEDLFAVQPAVASDGTLTFTPAPNQYGQAHISVVLRDDGGTANGGSDTSPATTITVDVLPVNDPPAFTAGPNITIIEDAGLQTRTGWATGITPGPNEDGQTVSFEVTGNTNPGLFSIPPAVDANGTLTFQPADNMAGSADISLRLTDDGGTANGGKNTSDVQTFNIMVMEENDPPQVNPATFTIDENSALGAEVGTVTFSDPDPGQTHTFAITGGNTNGAFAINNSGLISVAYPAALNFEQTPIFYLTVAVTDSALPPAVGWANITIRLNDVNDAPVVDPATFSLPENSPAGTEVGTVTARDDENDDFTFAITEGNTGGAFAISSSGLISVANPAALDFETAPTFSLTITATDDGGAAGTATITVNLSDINEPPQISDDTFSVDEFSQDGTIVGVLNVSNPETGQVLSYSILSGNTDNAFAVDADGNLIVANSDALDYNTNPSFALVVQVSDDATPPLSDTAQITVNVNNINDQPVVTGGSYTLDENTAIGTVLTTVTFTDRDAGQTHTFTIASGNTDNAFSINPTTGVITVAGALDYETLSTYSLVVEVTDNGTPPAAGTATIQVTIKDVNEPPAADSATFSLPENSPTGTLAGTLSVTDPDAGQSFTFEILSGNTGGAFTINNDGEITVASQSALDFESTNTFDLEIKITDDGVPAASTVVNVTVNLSDVNEAPNLEDKELSIDENLPNGTTVVTLNHNDPDAGQTHTFSIVTGNTDNAFAIDNNGNITVNNSTALNYEDERTRKFMLTVSVSDSYTPALSDTAVVTINLLNVNEAPVVTGESYQTIGNTMLEVAQVHRTEAGTPHIYVKGSLLDNDSDPDGDTIECEWDETQPTIGTVVISSTGEFTYTPPPGATSGKFSYSVIDSSGLKTTGTVTIEMKGMVWYVDNTSGPGGLGRSTDPFNTLASAQEKSAAGDTIYVFYGDGSTTGQNAGITLKTSQRLIGAGVALEMPDGVNNNPGPTHLLDAHLQPKIENTTDAGVTIINGSAEVRGLNIHGSTAGILTRHTTAGGKNLTVESSTISAGGNGFDLLTSAGETYLKFNNNTVTATSDAISIVRSSGQLIITAFANNQVSGDTGGNGAIIQSAQFDAAPGGGLDQVNLGLFTIGEAGNPVGGSGLVITESSGNLNFTVLRIHAQGDYGLRSSRSAYQANAHLITIADGQGTITASKGAAVSLTNLDINAPNLALTSTNSPNYGLHLVNVYGTLSTTNTSAISGSTTAAVLVDKGSANLTYNGTITQINGRTVEVTNRTGGSLSFTGAVNGGGTGVLLSNNNSSTNITFSGGLVLNTGANAALTANSAGKLSITGSSNTLSTTTGTALVVVNTTIGESGLNFRSISADGAVNGIKLENTDTLGGLVVTGTGTAGSGGTIQNTTGDGVRLVKTRDTQLNYMTISNAVIGAGKDSTCGPENAQKCTGAVSMDSTTNVTFNHLNVTGSGQMGISGYMVNGLSITNSSITNAGNENDEYGLLLHDPTGTVLVQDTDIINAYETGIRLYKTDQPLLNLTLRRVTVSGNDATYGEDGFQFKLHDLGKANILVENSTFTNLQRDGIDGTYQMRFLLNLTVRNSLFEDNYGYGGIIITGNAFSMGPPAEGHLTLDNNTFRNTVSTPIVLAGADSAILDAKVTNNLIENPSPPQSHIGEGIRLLEEDSTMTVLVSGNTISGVSTRGIAGYARLDSAGGSLHATVVENTASQPTGSPAHAIDFNVQDTRHTICLDMSGNSATGNNTAGINLRNSAGTFQIEGQGLPASMSPDEVITFINGENTSTPAANASGTFNGVAAGTCRDAVGATLPPVASGYSQQMAHATTRPSGPAKLAMPLQTAENMVSVNIGTLPAGKSVTVTFDVLIADPLPDRVFQVSNQARLVGSNFDDVVSDDPATGDSNDATITQLYRTAIAGDDEYSLMEDQGLTVPAPGVLGNDMAAAGYALTAVVKTHPATGTLTSFPDGSFVYQPNENDNGKRTFTYVAYDGVNFSNEAVVTLNIQPVNDAPVLAVTGDIKFNPVAANHYDNPGTPISELLASAGISISDVDEDALQGIAITAADTTHGQWQYTTTGGLVWENLGTVAASSARLLAGDANTRLRFVPQAGYTGIIDPAVTFHAWDRTSGSNGGTANVTTNGGTTAFSTAQASASLEVYQSADLVMHKSVAESATLAGNRLVFTLQVDNNGPTSADGVKITDRLPDGTTFVSASAGCTESAGVVKCDARSLQAGASASFDLTVDVSTGFTGTLTNTAEVTAATHDPNLNNNTASAGVNVHRNNVVVNPNEPPDPKVWSKTSITQPPCGSSFVGEFGNETVTLALGGLPQHSEVIIEFDLLIIRSWDGNEVRVNYQADMLDQLNTAAASGLGPDRWSMHVDGATVVDTTFSNWDSGHFYQAYPGSYPTGNYPARTGAIAINSLCYRYGSHPQDSVYRMRYVIPHSAEDLKIDFAASGLQPIEDESWGLDNVRVTLSSGADPMPYHIYMPFSSR